jgi:hypothetical protein
MGAPWPSLGVTPKIAANTYKIPAKIVAPTSDAVVPDTPIRRLSGCSMIKATISVMMYTNTMKKQCVAYMAWRFSDIIGAHTEN